MTLTEHGNAHAIDNCKSLALEMCQKSDIVKCSSNFLRKGCLLHQKST